MHFGGARGRRFACAAGGAGSDIGTDPGHLIRDRAPAGAPAPPPGPGRGLRPRVAVVRCASAQSTRLMGPTVSTFVPTPTTTTIITTASLILSANALPPEPPSFVAHWPAATSALPDQFLPDVPLLGNGHIGVLMDTRTDGPSAGHTSDSFTLRSDTRCNSAEQHSGKTLNIGLSQCEKLCVESPSCAVFSHGDAGSCFQTPQSCCFLEQDASQCTPGVPGYTSGVRAPNGPAPVPRGGLNATVNLQFGSNAMWALQTCDNASASAPFGPQWRPAMARACGKRIALGGLKVKLRVPSGVLNISSEQHYGSPKLVARLGVDGMSGVTVSSYMHPLQNMLVTNVTAGVAAVTVSLSTWAVSSDASPASATLGNNRSVGSVTRRAMLNSLPHAKNVVAALASSSLAVRQWQMMSEGAGVAVGAEVAIAANHTVSIYTAFADNALSNIDAVAVTDAAISAARRAVTMPGTAAAVADAKMQFWSEFWSRSAISLPSSPEVERYWYDASYITASMASSNPDIPPPGLYGPWVTKDNPAFGGDYTLDYNYEASFYGVFGSNHPVQAESYFGPVLAYQPVALKLGRLIARKLGLSAAACNASLHYPAGMAPWGYQDIDTHIYMHWNGDFASLLFLNHWEYTRNKTFAREKTWPLVAGLVNWWSCFLKRSVIDNGTKLVLDDWNAIYPDEEHETQPVKNPMIGLAFARRLASFQLMLSQQLGLPQPTAAVEIARSLANFPTNCSTSGLVTASGDGGSASVDTNRTCSWIAWGNATVSSSDAFSLYPIWPTEYVSQGSSADLLRTARHTVMTYVDQTDFVTGRPVLNFPAAVRAGFSSDSGYTPEAVISGLKAWLANTEHNNGVLQDRDDGRVEDCGVRLCPECIVARKMECCLGLHDNNSLLDAVLAQVMRAVNEMLLQAPNDGTFIELFPFFPANESVRNEPSDSHSCDISNFDYPRRI